MKKQTPTKHQMWRERERKKKGERNKWRKS